MIRRLERSACLLAAVTAFAAAAPASANVTIRRLSADPFTNSTSQHATEVEPDTFAAHGTVIAAVQVGRFTDGGSSDIGVARSATGGSTWNAASFLPGLTFNAGSFADPNSPYERVSDPSVAFDAAHNVWMVSSIPITSSLNVPTVDISRSTNDGVRWNAPRTIPPPVASSVDLDKNWTVCDDTATSPFYGHCYTQFDNAADSDRLLMSTSTDGGLTWSTPVQNAGHNRGLGGQPLVRPDGTVVVPYLTTGGAIAAFRSTDGGATWTTATTISTAQFHQPAGGLRSDPLPSAEIDGAGTVYVVWPDCRFRASCAANDLVISSSSSGTTWSAVARIPIDAVSSTADHFIPGLAVDPATSGAGAHLALAYYFYPNASCSASTCALKVGYISSPNGGATWSAATTLAGPMSLNDIAATSQGPMVGDYISTSNVGGRAVPVFTLGRPHTGSTFNQALYTPATPLTVATAATAGRRAVSTGAATRTARTTPIPTVRR